MFIYVSPKCSCIICHKEFSAKGIHTHAITAHTIIGKQKHLSAAKSCSKATGYKLARRAFIKNISKWKSYYTNLNITKCIVCHRSLDWFKRKSKFCGNSCSAIHNNKARKNNGYVISEEQKVKTRITYYNNHPPKRIPKRAKSKAYVKMLALPVLPFSKIKTITCAHCLSVFVSKRQVKYCNNCTEQYSHNGRAKYWFSFNVFHYPELFDLSMLQAIGFRNTKTNPDGITRDHKVSVNEAIRNNYDPYYITHPLNCELLPFRANVSKGTKSSVTYEYLKQCVHDYKSTNKS